MVCNVPVEQLASAGTKLHCLVAEDAGNIHTYGFYAVVLWLVVKESSQCNCKSMHEVVLLLQSFYRVHQMALKCAAHWRQLVARRRRLAGSVKTTETVAENISVGPSFSKTMKPQPSASYGPVFAR